MNAHTEQIKNLVLNVCMQHHSKLLHKKYAKLKKATDHPLFGLCYYASEAFYYLVKQNNPAIKGAYKRFAWQGNEISHWVVQFSKHETVDITFAQFLGEVQFDYTSFKGCGFQQLSDSAKFIIAEVEKRLTLL